ncbi:enoyl-CoA hydratase, partial [Lachnotalea glycerini]
MDYHTLRVRYEEQECYIQFYRPEANNPINYRMVIELSEVLKACDTSASIIILEGLSDVFCFGADFQGIHDDMTSHTESENNPKLLYELWLKLVYGPYIT